MYLNQGVLGITKIFTLSRTWSFRSAFLTISFCRCASMKATTGYAILVLLSFQLDLVSTKLRARCAKILKITNSSSVFLFLVFASKNSSGVLQASQHHLAALTAAGQVLVWRNQHGNIHTRCDEWEHISDLEGKGVVFIDIGGPDINRKSAGYSSVQEDQVQITCS